MEQVKPAPINLAVLGAGAWGTALAASWAPHHAVTLWGRNAAELDAMRANRVNARYLPDCPLPDALHFNPDFDAVVDAADLIVIAVPSHALRPTLAALARRAGLPPIVRVCKGFEPGKHKLPHQLIVELLPAHRQTGVLSGPSFAQEVAHGYPTALTLA
jgi:glycerol-3-phosphate dehydrogenase (NAD(P)+)